MSLTVSYSAQRVTVLAPYNCMGFISTFPGPNLRCILQVLRDGIRPDGSKFIKKGLAAEDQVLFVQPRMYNISLRLCLHSKKATWRRLWL